MQHNWYLGWLWLWVGALAVALALIPLAFGRRFRLAYATFPSLVAVIVVCTLGWRNLHGFEALVLICSPRSAASIEHLQFGLMSGAGGISVYFEDVHDLDPDNLKVLPKVPFVQWVRDAGANEYPGWRDPIFKGWGFQLTWFSELDKPGSVSIRHLCAFVCPAWFPVPFLLIMPALYARRVVKRMRVRRGERRLAAGCCPACDFDLRGTPVAADGSKHCGECGTVIPAPAKPAEAAKP